MNTAPDPRRTRAGRPQRNSYTDLLKPGESWDDLTDAAARRKIKNRLAQRAYRRNLRHRTKEVELLKSQIEELQQSAATKNNNKNITYTPNSPSSTDCGTSVYGTTSQAGTPPGFDRASSLPVSMTDRDWMGCSYLNTAQLEQQQHETLTVCLDWTTRLDHGIDGDDEVKADSASASTPTSTCASTIPSPLPRSSLGPIPPDCHVIQWQQPLDPTADAFLGSSVGDGVTMNYMPLSPSLPASSSTQTCITRVVEGSMRRSVSGATQPSCPDARSVDNCVCARLQTLFVPDASEPIIHLAIAHGNIDTLKLLLQDSHVPVNVRDKAGYTPLQRAVIIGRTEMVALLIKHGADPS
ncbi:Ankyrin-1 [Madurella fahalii]|uniref:Ankyrin-1 n=1 Tax=Madurella fahalii TaxID=1157608 RepID=A0ABQ0G0U7_9PEZI